MKITAYLAHTFALRHYVRDEAVPKLRAIGIETLNPFYSPNGNTMRPEVKVADEMEAKGINPRESVQWMKIVKGKNKTIVKRDLNMIEKSHIIIAFLEEWSGGTVCEIWETGGKLRRPVFLVTSNKIQIAEHPWMNYACQYGGKIILNGLDELIKVLKRKYGL